ncbi:MAG: alpha/beta hydrolase [Pseudomonadota bacterium]
MKLHYRDEGNPDGPTLVLVHGFSSSLHTWEHWVELLEDEYRLVSLDLPGHGLTRTPTLDKMQLTHFGDVIEEVVEELGIDRFTLIGHSMGGATSWQYALRFPERLDGLVLVAASGWRPDDEDRDPPLIFRLLANPVARTILRDLDTTRLTRDGLKNSFVDESFVTEEIVTRYVDLSRAPGHRDAIIELTSGRNGRVEANNVLLEPLAAIPTLILQGDSDNLVPARSGTLFNAAIEGSELKIYSAVGHVPQEEVAEQSVADLRAFLDARVHVEPLAEPAVED